MLSLDAHYKEMLKLAIESEEACDPVSRAVGSEILKIFPDNLVKEYKYTMSISEGSAKPILN